MQGTKLSLSTEQWLSFRVYKLLCVTRDTNTLYNTSTELGSYFLEYKI